MTRTHPSHMIAALPSNFTTLDWLIVAACLAVTTWFGHVLAGKQTTLRDFWLGGRKLPWYAVSASIVATQLSGTTFIVLPMMVYGSDFRYIQLALFGQLIARFIVGFVILPQYYKRDIYSPYEYMSQKLGPGVRRMTSALYVLTTVLTMGARIYVAALLLELMMRGPLESFQSLTTIRPIVSAMWLVGLVSMCWTLMGGIATVVWTDLILLIFFWAGAVVALFAVWHHLPGGASEMFRVAGDAGKFRLLDFSASPVAKFTIWTAVIGATVDGIGGLGTNQTVTQRLLCCRNAVHARWALISSWIGICVPLTCMLVGAALFAYYHRYPLTGEAAAFVKADPNRLFPHFILTVLPAGICGLIVAAIIAAALASLESVQAALSQVTLSNLYLPWRQRRAEKLRTFDLGSTEGHARSSNNPLLGKPTAFSRGPTGNTSLNDTEGLQSPAATSEDRDTLFVSRLLILFWSVILCLSALFVERLGVWRPDIAPTLIDLMGQLASYAGGALLAGFLLAFLPLRIDGRGYLFSAPLSVLTVFALVWHDPWAQYATATLGAVIFLFWLTTARRQPTAEHANAEHRTSNAEHRTSNAEHRTAKTKHQSPKTEPPTSVTAYMAQTVLLLLALAGTVALSRWGYFGLTPAGAKAVLAWPWYVLVGTLVGTSFGYLLARKISPVPAPTLEPLSAELVSAGSPS